LYVHCFCSFFPFTYSLRVSVPFCSTLVER